jgi:hypothetical protein
MTRHASSSPHHRSGSGFKGIKLKKDNTDKKQSLPAKAIAIIVVFLAVFVIIIYFLTR